MSYLETKNIHFKNEEIHKNAKVGFYMKAHYHTDKIIVEIDDLSKPVWQLPLKVLSIGGLDVSDQNITTKDVGNPKIKEYSYEEFDKIFKLF